MNSLTPSANYMPLYFTNLATFSDMQTQSYNYNYLSTTPLNYDTSRKKRNARNHLSVCLQMSNPTSNMLTDHGHTYIYALRTIQYRQLRYKV